MNFNNFEKILLNDHLKAEQLKKKMIV
jgi:hypothetical protein